MKSFKKMIAVVTALAMITTMGLTAMASSTYGETNAHVITITNTDQNVSHTYEAYQVFSGNLDSKELTLSDITWGTGVDGDSLLTALKGATDPALLTSVASTDALGNAIAANTSIFANCASAQDVAKVMATLQSTGQKYNSGTGVALSGTANNGTTDNAGAIDAVATIIADNLATKTADFSETSSGTYTANVSGDGYYFIKDTTTNANLLGSGTSNSDTRSKYLLSVVRDVTIVAKDTGLNPDKEILKSGTTTVKADSAAIGDTVNFQVTVTVPNTKKYEKDFWFVMNDKLPVGITFTGITSVMIDSTEVKDIVKNNATSIVASSSYDGSTGYYTLGVGTAAGSETDVTLATSSSFPGATATIDTTKYTFEQGLPLFDAVKEPGGQAIRLTFNQFKKFVEKNDLIGKTLTVKYTGVVNDDAEYEATENENEVTFKYSNDPNHDYNGDTPDNDSVTGTTPKQTTRTYTTSLKINKVDENGQPLEGAEFTLTGTALNRTVITGTKFVPSTYTLDANNDEAYADNKDYYLLKDGSYTDTDPSTVQNTTQYSGTTAKYRKVSYNFVELAAGQTPSPLVITTNASGTAEFVGLNAGDYTLEETHSPEGYNKIDGQAAIAISWVDPQASGTTGAAKTQGGFTITTSGTAAFANQIKWESGTKQFTVTIENRSGSVLPTTGGIGTTLFYVGGAILVLLAGILLVSKRRIA
jgi:fimbrial isopeptide formation D2 family protein/LPXTG-motif cell wall-anchored protein